MDEENSYSHAPNSPLHPAADQEVNGLPDEILPESELDFLDLNPDLEARAQSREASVAQTPVNPEPRATQVQSDHHFDRMEDFQPVLVPSPLNPSKLSNGRRLSLAQQSKFINYVDERLLHIQRRFTQSFGLGELGYRSINELITDVKQLLNFIWYSIGSDDDGDKERKEYLHQDSTNFGQSEYLIRIAGDLVEYVGKMEINQDSAINVLKLMKSLDEKFARLIDGKVPGGEKLRGTEQVRISGIAERSRLLMVELFEREKIEGFHYELSKIYDESLERIG